MPQYSIVEHLCRRTDKQAKVLMREYMLMVRFTEAGKCYTQTWLNGNHQPMEDTTPSKGAHWRLKLRERARELLGQQPDANFSLRGKAVLEDGEEKAMGLWYPGHEKKWFGATAKERGTLRNRAPYMKDPVKEQKWLDILATRRPL